MLRRRVVMVLTLLVTFAVPLGGAFAQGGSTVFCGDLDQADCDLLVQSEAAMQALESAAFDMTMDFSITSDQELMDGMDTLAMSMNVVGAAAADMAVLGDFQDMTLEDLPQMMESLPELVGTVLRGVAGDVTLTIELPVELMAAMSVPGMDSLVLELMMVDGVLYINLDTLAPLMGEAGETGMTGWLGLDLAGMYEVIFEQMGDELDAQMQQQMEQMQALFSSEFFTAMNNPDFLEGFMAIERLDDVDNMGQTMAVFQTTFDYEALLANEAFQAGFQEYMEAVMAMQADLAGDLPENFEEVMGQAALQMMSGINLSLVQWVGLEDLYTHHLEMVMDFDMDFAALAGLVPEEADEMPGNFAMSMSLVLDLGGFNEPVELVAPEGATVINPMMMMAPGAMPG